MDADELIAPVALAIAKAAKTLGITLDQDVAEDCARAALLAVREAAGVPAKQLRELADWLEPTDEDPVAALLRALAGVQDE